jgi:hypothetical protein
MTTNIFDEFDEQSQTILQRLKPLDFEGMQSGLSNIINNFNNFQRKTPFANSSLSKNGNDVRDNFFRSSKIYNYNSFEIIVDPSSGINPPDKIKPIETSFYYDTNGSGEGGDTVKGISDKYAFTVKLFISKIEKQLTNTYNDPLIIPEPKEILLFLEDNSDDWSGATLYIKKGKDVTDLKFINDTMANNPNFTDYIQSKNNISLSDLKELLTKDKVENNTLNLISTLFEISSFFVTDSSLLKGVAEGIGYVNEKIKKNCSFEDKSWNPSKAETNKPFEPILFPGSNNFLDSLNDDEINNTVTKIIDNFNTKFKEYDEKIIALLSSNMGVVPLPVLLPPFMFIKNVDVIPKTFEDLLLQKYMKLRSVIQSVLTKLPSFDLSSIIKEGINILNAFLCGIWNGFIDAICGIISLVQYLFEGAEFIAELLENFKEKGPQLLEKIDDCILAFQKIDFGKIFDKLASGIVTFFTSGSSISLVEIAYFSGAFVGFVVELAVEIVVGILFTGGALTIEAVIAKIVEAFKAIVGIAAATVKGAIKITQKTVSAFAKGFDWLLEFLLKGTDEIIKIIDDVFAKIKQVADDLTKKIVDDVSDLSKTELDWMASRKTGNLGGNILKASQIRKLRGLLKEKGITLIVDGDLRSIKKLFKPLMGFDTVDDLFRFMSSRNPPLVGGFDAVTKQFILSKNATEIIAFHELAHLKHMEEVGETIYNTLSKLDKEMFVWKQILKNRKTWTEAELLESLNYINRIRVDDYGLEPIIIKL